MRTQTKSIRTLSLAERKAFRNAYRGAVLLDKEIGRGRWVGTIDVSKICMSDQCQCILGQHYAPAAIDSDDSPYGIGLDELLPARYGSRYAQEYAAEHHGFTVDDYCRVGWPDLDRAWTYLLPRWEVA